MQWNLDEIYICITNTDSHFLTRTLQHFIGKIQNYTPHIFEELFIELTRLKNWEASSKLYSLAIRLIYQDLFCLQVKRRVLRLECSKTLKMLLQIHHINSNTRITSMRDNTTTHCPTYCTHYQNLKRLPWLQALLVTKLINHKFRQTL